MTHPLSERFAVRRIALAFALAGALLPAVGVAPADAAVATCMGLEVTIPAGTGGNDIIQGTDGDDVIQASGGNDTSRAGAGNDIVCGGGGNDQIFGEDVSRPGGLFLWAAGDQLLKGAAWNAVQIAELLIQRGIL